MRLIHQGKYSDAITLDKLFLSEAAAAGRMGGSITKAAEARRETFKEIISVLPDIQRQLLELKLDDYSSTAPGAQNPVTDLSASWEDVAEATPRHKVPPATPMSASAAFRKANPEVAVLRAFAQSNGPSSKLEGTPAATGTPGPSRARTPGSVRHPMRSTQFGKAPGTPINAFLSRPKFASAPFDLSFVSGSISASPFSTPARDARVRHAPSYSFQASISTPPASSPFSHAPPGQIGGSSAPAPTISHPIKSSQQFDPFKPSKALSHTPWLPRSANGVANPVLGQSIVTPSKRTRASLEPLWQEPEVHMRSPADDGDKEEDKEEARLNRLAAPFSNPPPRRSLSVMQEDAADAEDAEEAEDVLTRDEGIEREFPGAFPHREEQRPEEQNTNISEAQRDRLALPAFISSAPTPRQAKTTRNKSSDNNASVQPADLDISAPQPRVTSRNSQRVLSISDAGDEGASRQLRRSSRLSAAPSSPEPKSKKARSSSPPPTGTKSGAIKSKRKSSKSNGPPTSKRSTRRTTSVLQNVEE